MIFKDKTQTIEIGEEDILARYNAIKAYIEKGLL